MLAIASFQYKSDRGFLKKKNAKCIQIMNKYLLCRKHNIMKYNRKINVNLYLLNLNL